jgi:hypothetical protein
VPSWRCYLLFAIYLMRRRRRGPVPGSLRAARIHIPRKGHSLRVSGVLRNSQPAAGGAKKNSFSVLALKSLLFLTAKASWYPEVCRMHEASALPARSKRHECESVAR